jgi:GPH family glycoside/pentoside/hexuronide:cation symporter
MSEGKSASVGFAWKQRIGLGITEFGRNIGDFMITSYLMLYLTDVARIPAAAISLMFLLCRCFDAVTDYLVGVFVDRTRTKIGRSKPWMYPGAFVLAVGLVMVFHVPDLSTTGKVAYVAVAYLIENFGMTLVAIPEGALIPALSTDAKERTKLASMRGIAGGIANLCCANIATYFIMSAGAEAVGYARSAMGFAAITIICVVGGISLLREVNVPEFKPSEKVSVGELLGDLKALLTDRYYLFMLFYGLTQLLGLIPIFSMMAYYFINIFGNPMYISLAFTITSIVPTIASATVPFVNAKLTKRQCALLGQLFYAIAFILMFIARTGNIALFVVALIFWGFGNGYIGTMLWAMQPEIFDNLEYKTGKVQAALPTAMISYACKLGNALAGAITAALLAWGHYDGALEVQPDSAKTAILLGFIGVPFVANLLMAIATWFYDLDKKYPEIRAELDKRHQAKHTNA